MIEALKISVWRREVVWVIYEVKLQSFYHQNCQNYLAPERADGSFSIPALFLLLCSNHSKPATAHLNSGVL